MKKPTKAILKDGEIEFKELCQMFRAEYCWIEGVKYRLPESWLKKT